MCRYIRDTDSDPVIQQAAAYCSSQMACGSADPAMKAWGAFWLVKHLVRFVVDDAPLDRWGEFAQQDLLTSPSVLIRLNDPAEDCDGFTMLVCALLRAMGVRYQIVTVAASPDDPSRWSHVFAMAMLPGGPLPLDASHGAGPGWMVPSSHTFRWQCWDENGKAVDTPRPQQRGLHGWVPATNGLAEVDLSSGFSYDPTSDNSGGVINPNTGETGVTPWGTPATTLSPISNSPGSSFNLTSFLNNLTNAAAGVAKVAELPSTAFPQQYGTGVATSLGSFLPVILGGVLLFIAVKAVSSK